MATSVTPIVELDFDKIKSDIITFIKSDPTFSDYNFEGSALNAIVDMLAYNTHTNAYYANMLHSESFLDTAQKRSSVVSKAKELGYVPKSVTGSEAVVNITTDSVPTSGTYTLTRGASLTSSNDNGTYTFLVVDDAFSVPSTTTHVFSGVHIVAGTLLTNYFNVDTVLNTRSIFTIPNKNVDTRTLKVYVKSSVNAEKVEYFHVTSIFDQTPTSKSYFLQESYDGFFQIYFGQDVLGIQPVSGNFIEISYIVSSDLELPDGCRTFVLDSGVSGTNITNIETVQVAYGGSDKESIYSIKTNAVSVNASKNRAVTSSDYISVLLNNINTIKAVSVWGGEDSVPPVYGKVFVSMLPKSGYTISDAEKTNTILPLLKKYSVMTIIPEFIDPIYTNIDFTTTIKFNSNKTTTSKYAAVSSIKTALSSYIDTISTFNGDYIHSDAIKLVADIDPGVSSVSISKRVGFKLTPRFNVLSKFNNILNNSILSGSIISTKFNTYLGGIKIVYIKEIPDTSVNNQVSLGLYDTNNALVSNIGSVNLTTGEFNFSVNVYSYITNTRFITIRCSLVNDDINVFRNQVLLHDTNVIDTNIGLLDNNTVTVEDYSK